MQRRWIWILMFWMVSSLLFAQFPYRFTHGPYLQEPSATGMTVVFTTSAPGFSWVELMKPGEPPVNYYRVRNGLREAGNTLNAVRMTGLQPATRYLYRICSRQVDAFDPYRVAFGDSLVSDWIPFRTVDPQADDHSFLIMSDIHGDTVRLRKLLNRGDYNSCDAVIFVGDMADYLDTPDALFRGFIDRCTDLFATRIPFVAVRGNHETRGAFAHTYSAYIPREDGLIYGAYRWGDVMMVMLDAGEDKPDSRQVYAGLTDFDAYRSQQAAWLRNLVAGPIYRTAHYRIVLSHYATLYPTICDRMKGLYNHGMADMSRKFLPVLNDSSVDLMLSGHTHRFAWYLPGDRGNRFPVVVGSDRSAVRLDVGEGTIRVRAFDEEGRTLLEKIIEVKSGLLKN